LFRFFVTIKEGKGKKERKKEGKKERIESWKQ